jgi:hypothetical protein
MHEFTHELLQLRARSGSLSSLSPSSSSSSNINGDETILSELESSGSIVILLQSIRFALQYVNSYDPDSSSSSSRGAGEMNTIDISPHFFNSACIALVHFCYQSQHRAVIAYQDGAFDTIVQVMRRYRAVDYVQVIGIVALMIIGRNHPIQTNKCTNNYYDIETSILREIVIAMESHQNNPKLYTVACSAMGNLFGLGSSSSSTSSAVTGWSTNLTFMMNNNTMIHALPPSSQQPQQCTSQFDDDWYHRALSAICYGILLHADDDGAMMMGNTLLVNIVGPDVARDMVGEIEWIHGVVQCAAAA